MVTPVKNWLNGGHFYSHVASPLVLFAQFTVTPTNGLGVTSLKSNGALNNVFMHTSTTPSANNGYTNPNPANGLVMIQMKSNFNIFLGAQAVISSPTTGSAIKIDNAALTPGQAYIISVVGNATAATWQGVGLPVGVTPAVGVPFIATAAGGSGNVLTSRVLAVGVSATSGLEMVSANNLALTANSNIGSNSSGSYLIGQFLGPTISTGDYVAPMIPTAPATGSVVSMALYFDQSSVTIDGL